MATAKTMHGARAKISIAGRVVGIFNNVSYGLQYDVQPVYILGSFGPKELVYTGQEVVNLSMSGWRIVDHGPHDGEGAQVPKLQDLLNHEDVQVSIFDRQNDAKPIMEVQGFRPTGYQTTISQRGLQEITVNGVGLTIADESGEHAEAAGSTELP